MYQNVDTVRLLLPDLLGNAEDIIARGEVASDPSQE
jgi:hypothetical protein